MLHQRRFPPRDVSRKSQPQRGQERSLSRDRVKKASIDSMARKAVTASGSRHWARVSSGLVPFSSMDLGGKPACGALRTGSRAASAAGGLPAAIAPKTCVDASRTA